MSGIRQALEYLFNLGHRSIGFISHESLEYLERYKAYADYLQEKNLSLKKGWIVSEVPKGRDGGHEGFKKLKKAGRLPTAVFCTRDDLALGFIDKLRASGLKCPEDISVVGFGNESADGPYALHELTTIDHLREEYARDATRMLGEQIQGIRKGGAVKRVSVHLLIRSSCSSPSQ